MAKSAKLPDVKKELEIIASEICDHYCKFPDQYFDTDGCEDEQADKLRSEHCESCPLLQFLTG